MGSVRRSARQSDSSRIRLNLETLEDRIALTGDLAILETPVVHAVAEPRHIIVAGAGAGGEPRVNVRDAASNQVLFDFLAYPATYRGGVNVASGDVNGDGVLDVVTAPAGGGGPHIRIFNGVNGSLIREYFAYSSRPRGINIAVGDVNNDGFADVISAPGFGGGPHVRVFSGANNTILTEFFAFGSAFRGGVNVASGDVNGDSFDDIIVAPDSGAGPHVRVFSGASPSTQLANFFAYNENFQGGVNVGAGDVNNDGFDDVITGPASNAGPHVRAFSGADPSTRLANFFAFNQTFQGGVTVASADANNDNSDDIIVGPASGAPPNVRVFSGANQSTLQTFRAISWDLLSGVNVGGGIGNKPPVISSNNPLTVAEGASGTITSANLNSFDRSAFVYVVTSLPANGRLFLDSSPLSRRTRLTQSDIDNNLLTYTHDGSETISDGFEFVVVDIHGASSSGTFSIIVTPVNDRPEVNLDPDDSGGNSPNFNVTFTEDGGPVMLGDVDLSVFDPDSQITGATVQIVGGAVNTQDALAAVDQGGVTSSFNMVLSTLTLTGTASPAVYQTVLRSVTYDNISDNPTTAGQRTVEFKVNDGAIDSIGVGSFITVVAVNDPPVLADIETAALAYTEGDGPVEITSTVTVDDVDDTMIESAVIQITGNYQNGEDFLADNGSVPVAISVGAFNATNGSITLTGPATLAEYQTALRAITYENTSVAPSEATRTVSFTVNDGDADGNTATRDVEVTSVNDPPMATADSFDTIGNTQLEVSAAPSIGFGAFVAGSVLDNDVDGDNVLTVTGTSNVAAGASVSMNADGTFVYAPTPGATGMQTFDYTVSDGTDSDTATVTINIFDMVWYVDNSSAAGGLGGSADPFDTLAEAEAASSMGDAIYVFEGDGMTTGQDAGITLKDNQRLIGEGVELSLNVGLNGNAAPTVLRAAGSAPVISNTSGDVVTLANTNEVAGVSINAQFTGLSGGAVRGHAVAGGSLRDVNIILTFANGIFLTDSAGNFSVDASVISGQSSSLNGAINIDGGDGDVQFTNTDIVVTGGGELLQIHNKTGGSVTFGNMGMLSLTGGTGNFGIDLFQNSGTSISFNNGFSINTASADGLRAVDTDTVNIGGTSSFIDATGGRAMLVDGVDIGAGWTFANLTSTGPVDIGVILDNVTGGNFAVTGSTTVDNSSSAAILVSNATNTGIDFGTTILGQTTPVGSGVALANGNTATFTFDSLDVTTSFGAGLAAQDAVVNIGGTTNTINATGNAILANGTDLGGGWTFDNITATVGGLLFIDVSNGDFTVTGSTIIDAIVQPSRKAIEVTQTASSSFNFGNTQIGQTTPVTNGIDITQNGGTFTFTSLDVTTSAGPGLLTGNTTVNVGGTANTITAVGGTGIQAIGTNLGSGWTFDNVSASGGSYGLRLYDITTGDFAVTGNTTIDDTSFHAIQILDSDIDFSFGTTQIGQTVAVNEGVRIGNSNSGTFTFNSLDVATSAGTGLSTSNATVSIGGTANTIHATGGLGGIVASGTDMDGGWTFDNVTASGGLFGVRLSNAANGDFTVTGSTTIDDTSDVGILVSGAGSSNFDFGATQVGQTTAVSGGVDISSSLNTGSFTFSSLDVTTSAGDGLLAGGSTVTIGGTNNTINATGGIGIRALDTNLGGGWTFDNVTASGGMNGLNLSNLSNGDFTVSGTTTIDNTSGYAIDADRTVASNFSFGTTQIGQTTAATRGVDISIGNGGAFTFSSLDVATSAGIGLLTGDSTVNIGGASNTISAVGGAGIRATDTNMGGGWTFDNVTASGGLFGVRLSNVSNGAFTVTGSTNVDDTSDFGILVAGTGSTEFDFGTTLVGQTTAVTSGISLSALNATIAFSSLDVTTNNGVGLLAGENTIIGGSTNSINAIGGPAIRASLMTMSNGAGGGWTFDEISSVNSTSEGILLSNVSGDLTVTGTTTITNSDDSGIEVVGTNASSDFRFSTTNITDSGGNGVELLGVDGSFTINSAGGGITFNNTVDLHGVRIHQSENVTIGGTDASNRFTITGAGSGSGTSSVNGTGHHGVVSTESGDQRYDFLNVTGVGVSGPPADIGIYVFNPVAGATIDVNNSVFSNIGADATRIEHTVMSGLLTASFTNNDVSGNGLDYTSTDDGISLLLNGTPTAQVVATINNNVFTGVVTGIRTVLTLAVGLNNTNSLTINNNDVFESNFGLIYRTEDSADTDVSIDDLVVDADTGLSLNPNSGPGIDVSSLVIDDLGGTGNDVNTSETRLTITNSAVRDQNFEGIRIRHFGDDGADTNQGIITALLDNVTASNNGLEGLLAEAGDGGTLNITVRDSSFTGNNGSSEDTRFGFRNQLMGSMPVLRVYLDGTESNNLFRFDGSPNPEEVSELAQEAGGPVTVGTNPVTHANIIDVLNFNGNTTGGGAPAVLTDSSYRDHTTIINVGGVPTPLLAAEGMATGGEATSLTAAVLTSIVEAAIDRWAEAGVSDAQLAHLRAVSVDVSDLPGAQLGGATPWMWTIRLDVDAAGHGWFVDATPDDDAEFARYVGGTEIAASEAQAAGAIDLLTVVAHELGHILGLADLDPSVAPHQLMTATLPTGARRLIAAPLGVVASLSTSSSGAAAPALATAGGTSTAGATESIVVFSDGGSEDSSGSSEASMGDASSGGASDEQFSSDAGSEVDGSSGRSHEPHSAGGGLLLLDTDEVARLDAPAVDADASRLDMIVIEESALVDVLDDVYGAAVAEVASTDETGAKPLELLDGFFSDTGAASERLRADVTAEEAEAGDSSSDYALAALAAIWLARPHSSCRRAMSETR